nr:putative gustatory receptor 2a isoform X2 [Bactrocera oleae]
MIFVYFGTEALKLWLHFLANDQNYSINLIFYLLPFYICGVRYFQIFTAIMIVRHRLDKLVTAMNELNLLNSKPKQNTGGSSNTNIKFISQASPVYEITDYLKHQYDMENADMKRLLIIRDLYNRLWELTVTLNYDFGISILTNVGNDFISITANCYWIFLNLKTYSTTLQNFLEIARSLTWSTPHLFNVLMLALLCERTVQRTTAIALGLHRIETNIWNDNHNTVIAGATTTYLIILIQFHMGEDKLTTN